MKFVVADEVFQMFPKACFGVVVARGFRPAAEDTGIADMLRAAVAATPAKFPEGVKQHPAVQVWRSAFTTMGCNPNKFLSSVEALASRTVKSGAVPHISGIVDLVNALSLKYLLPMGAHDIARIKGNIELRLSREGDIFTPFGANEAEAVPAGEIVYADGEEVRTRRWVWRQGERAKIVADTCDVFFPIDGFKTVTEEAVRRAREELAALAAERQAAVQVFWIDAQNREAAW